MPDTKIKILYIADSTSIHTQRWLSYFYNRGYPIYIVTIGRKRYNIPNIHHLTNFDQFYYNSPAFLTNLFKARRLIQNIQPDILHAHFIHQYGWLGALSGYHPFIATAWGTDILKLPHVSRGRLGKWLTQYTLKKADALTATSEAARQEAVRLGADSKTTEVVFWGVDTEKFKPEIDTQELRRRLKISENAPVVFSNRNYAPLYNNDIVIKAMAVVLKQFPEAVLILQNAGGGVQREAALKNLVEQMGIGQSVRFLPQYQHDALPPLYALADIYVSVPSWDAGPVSLKEAMASHCSPIISNVTGPMEWIRHEENGIVVPVQDVQRLAAAICDLLSDKAKRLRFNVINRNLIVEKAEHRRQMEKVESLYLKMVGRKNVSHGPTFNCRLGTGEMD